MPGRPVLQTLGVALLGLAALSGEIAWLHMRWALRTYGEICGSAAGAAHCAACPVGAAALVVGVACLIAARPLPAFARG